MNKISLLIAALTGPLYGVATTAAAEPFAPVLLAPVGATRLFAAADRQLALSEQVQGELRPVAASGFGSDVGLATRLRFGTLSDRTALLDPLGPLLQGTGPRFLSSAEFEQKVGRAVGIVTVGLLRDTGAVPGSQQASASALSTRPSTTYTAISLGYALSSRSALMLMASYGRTEGIGNPDSWMAQVSSLRTRAFSVGWSTHQVFYSGDRLALTLSVPAQVRSGTLGPSGYTAYSGASALAGAALNLRPSSTERDLELSYTTRLGRDAHSGKLTGAIMWRAHPGHDASAQPEWLTGLRYSHGF